MLPEVLSQLTSRNVGLTLYLFVHPCKQYPFSFIITSGKLIVSGSGAISASGGKGSY